MATDHPAISPLSAFTPAATGEPSPRILFYEDEEDIRQLIIRAFEREGYIIKGLACPAEFSKEIRSFAPDLILLDILMPNLDGIKLCRILKSHPDFSGIKIIFLTALDQEERILTAYDSGADDYITKPVNTREVMARVNTVLRRTGRASRHLRNTASLGPLVIDSEAQEARLDGKPLALTYTEFCLLAKLASKPGQIFNRRQLMGGIRRSDGLAEPETVESNLRTIDVHIRTLRRKLGEYGSLIKTRRGLGYYT